MCRQGGLARASFLPATLPIDIQPVSFFSTMWHTSHAFSALHAPAARQTSNCKAPTRVLVERDVAQVARLLHLAAGDALGAQVPQHQVVVCGHGARGRNGAIDVAKQRPQQACKLLGDALGRGPAYRAQHQVVVGGGETTVDCCGTRGKQRRHIGSRHARNGSAAVYCRKVAHQCRRSPACSRAW